MDLGRWIENLPCGGSCRDAVLGYLNWAQQLRGTTASDSVRGSLDTALARLHGLAGWASDDLCLPGSAERCHLRFASFVRSEGRDVTAAGDNGSGIRAGS